MTQDNQTDFHSPLYLQNRAEKLESDIKLHLEGHEKANKLLMQERQKTSTLESNIQMLESEKQIAYKQLKPYAEFINKISPILIKLDRPIRTLSARVDDNTRIDKSKHSQYIMPVKKLLDLINKLNSLHIKFNIKKKDKSRIR